MRLRIKHDEIDEPMRERKSVSDIQHDADKIGQSGEHCVDSIQNRSDKKESELDGFCYPGKKRGDAPRRS